MFQKYETLNPNFEMKYLLALLNSKLINFWYCNKYRMPTIGLYELHSIPIKETSKKYQTPFITIVNKILDAKKQDSTADTSEWERVIDVMVYHLYGLVYEEAKIIEPELSEEEFNKYTL